MADCDNYRIVKYDMTGTFERKWGTQGQGDYQFQQPRDVAVDKYGYVYVADGTSNNLASGAGGWQPLAL